MLLLPLYRGRHYYLQLQGYLNLMNLEHGTLYCFSLNHGATRFDVTRDRTLWLIAHALLEIMLNDIEQGRKHLINGEEEKLENLTKQYRLRPGEKQDNLDMIDRSKNNHIIYTKKFNPFGDDFFE